MSIDSAKTFKRHSMVSLENQYDSDSHEFL